MKACERRNFDFCVFFLKLLLWFKKNFLITLRRQTAQQSGDCLCSRECCTGIPSKTDDGTDNDEGTDNDDGTDDNGTYNDDGPDDGYGID